LSAIGSGAVALGLAVAVGIGPVALTAGVATVVGWLAPEAALARRVARRRREVAAQLADLVDELAVMVRAGLGLDAAMARAAQGARGALGEELSRVVQERRLGASRSEALSGFSTRMDLGDVNAVVAALAQAEELGVPVADALEVQSDALRVRRRQRAQEHAMTLPVRLLFPLVTCIFPALLVVLLGPAALSLIRGW
jgi:tight adherence protein C